MTAATASRRRAYQRGARSESLAAWYLRLKGYRILARRFKSPGGEIDLIAARGSIVVFVEVKARDDQARALAAVTPRQRRRIEAAAASFISRNRRYQRHRQRFDIIVMGPGKKPLHLTQAWRPGWD